MEQSDNKPKLSVEPSMESSDLLENKKSEDVGKSLIADESHIGLQSPMSPVEERLIRCDILITI